MLKFPSLVLLLVAGLCRLYRLSICLVLFFGVQENVDHEARVASLFRDMIHDHDVMALALRQQNEQEEVGCALPSTN